jgi:hypothetical protein
MTRLIPSALLMISMLFSGCGSGTWHELEFPWREARQGESQVAVNAEVTEACPYNGRISILCRSGYYSEPNPERHKTRVDMTAWLKADPQRNIMSETIWIDAYRLEVVQRMGDASGSKIILKDQIDGTLYEINLQFDSSNKTVKIATISDNIRK